MALHSIKPCSPQDACDKFASNWPSGSAEHEKLTDSNQKNFLIGNVVLWNVASQVHHVKDGDLAVLA